MKAGSVTGTNKICGFILNNAEFQDMLRGQKNIE